MLSGRSAADDRAGGPPRPADDGRVLLARIAEGDRRAFETLYRDYHPRLTRFLAPLVAGRPHLVEELVDDTLLAVWRKPHAYGGGSRLSTWIFAIAYRKAIRARGRWDQPREDLGAAARPSDEAGPEQQMGRRQSRDALIDAMARLSPHQRAVVDLTYFQEASCREIAQMMHCPVDTVKTRMFHARRSLKGAFPGALADWL